MTKKALPQDRGLTIEQNNAIDLLVTGKTDAETAGACGVTRQTVNDWRNNNAAFLAELNRRRAELWESDIDTLRGLVRESIAILADDLRSNDAKIKRAAAIHILRAVGIYGNNWKPDGDTNETTISLDMALGRF